jgi:uncharacterized protein YciI
MDDHATDPTTRMPSGAASSIEPTWYVEATYAPDAAETRTPFRPEHLDGVRARLADGRYAMAGAYSDISASVVIVRAASAAEAVALVSDDVYLRNGVWVEIRARPFGLVVAATA